MTHIIPSFLSKQDKITIVAPARFVERSFIDFAVDMIRERGFQVSLGNNLFVRRNQFAGSDSERIADFNDAIRDPECRAILCARGGYGTTRLLKSIDWDAWNDDPKWVVGYSDITALHSSVYNRLNMESIHGSMPVNFQKNSPTAVDDLFGILMGNTADQYFEHDVLNRPGQAEGILVGGNLSVLYSLLGSKEQLDTAGKILFLEDLDEYLYHMDRMMLALDRAGMLENLAGFIIGGMTDMNDNEVPFGATAREIIAERVAKYHYPVAFGFPAGHIDDNRPWTHGKKRRLTVLNDQPSSLNHC